MSSFAKCFLNKAIFEYMVESSRAKKARLLASARFKNSRFVPTMRPAMHLVSSLRTIRARASRVAIGQENDSVAASANCLNSAPVSDLTAIKDDAEVEGGKGCISQGSGAEAKMETIVTEFKPDS